MAVKIRLSEASLRSAQRASAIEYRDPAFPLRFRFHRARKSGSWYIVKQGHWYLVGHWPQISVAAIKRILPDKLAQLAINGLVRDTLGTVSDVLDWYQQRIQNDGHRSKSRRATIHSMIRCHLLPQLGDFSLYQVTPKVLDESLIWPLQQGHSLATVKAALSVLKQAFKQAQRLNMIASNPVASVVYRDFITVTEPPKDPRITTTELPVLFQQLAQQPIQARCLILLMLAFGTRIRETLTAKWAYIDHQAGLWVIPAQDAKTRKAHQLPLSPQLDQFLKDYHQWQQCNGYQGAYLFPGFKRGQPMSYSAARKLIKPISEDNWSAHDLRRLARTIWADVINVDYFVGELLLNHTPTALDKAYIQKLLEGPMRQAIEQYHNWLEGRGMAQINVKTELRSFGSLKANRTNQDAA